MGTLVGTIDGVKLGTDEGAADGARDGTGEGIPDGIKLGDATGADVGQDDLSTLNLIIHTVQLSVLRSPITKTNIVSAVACVVSSSSH